MPRFIIDDNAGGDGGLWANVQVPDSAMREAAWNDRDVDRTLALARQNSSATEPVLLKTGAKAYYQRGGWWSVFGYEPHGRDVYSSVELLKRACGIPAA